MGDVVWGETCFFAFVGECVLYNFAKLACYFLAVARRMKTERAWNEHLSLAQLFSPHAISECNMFYQSRFKKKQRMKQQLFSETLHRFLLFRL